MYNIYIYVIYTRFCCNHCNDILFAIFSFLAQIVEPFFHFKWFNFFSLNLFSTYCKAHRSHQDLSLLTTKQTKFFCPICLERFDGRKSSLPETVVKTPCCTNVFLHKKCIQVRRLLVMRGHFFLRYFCCFAISPTIFQTLFGKNGKLDGTFLTFVKTF